MKVSVEVPVHAPKHNVWKAITDIEHAADRISGIDEIRILEKPSSGLAGLKWKETRTLFGKTATETMWITDAVEDEYYSTEARNHGCLYKAKIHLTPRGDVTQLAMDFEAIPEKTSAKVLSLITGVMFRGATKKALQQDLDDIKAACEGSDSPDTATPVRS